MKVWIVSVGEPLPSDGTNVRLRRMGNLAQYITADEKDSVDWFSVSFPAPPVGSTLGPFGINLPGFTKEFNARTADKPGLIIPVVVTIYQDRSFTFILKTPPAPVLIKKALGLETASAKPNSVKVGKLTKAQVEEIAKTKMPDLNCTTLEST